MARVSARVIFVRRVVLGETLSVDWRERGLMGRTPSVTACRLCQLPRRGRPWQRGQVSSSFVNGRKKPLLSCKLSAFAKASPFRERWHGEAVTERVDFRDKPLPSPTATALPKGEPLAKRVGLVLIRQRQEEASVKLQTFRLCQSLSLSGEVARRSRDGEGCLLRRTPSVISLCEMPTPPRETLVLIGQ